MLIVRTILSSFLLAFAVAAVFGILPLMLSRIRKGSEKWLATLYLTGILTGFWAGFAFIHQALWPELPPLDSGHWFLYFLIPFWALSLGQVWKTSSFLVLSLIRGTLVFSMTQLILSPLRAYNWSSEQSLMVALAVALLFSVYTGLLDALAEGSPGSLYPTLLGLTCTASALLFMLGSSAVLNQQTMLIGMTLLVPLGILFWKKELKASQGLMGLSSFLLLSHWLNAWLFASLDKWSIIALLAPFSSLVLKIPFLEKQPQWRQHLIVWGFALLYLSTIVLIVFVNQPNEAYPY